MNYKIAVLPGDGIGPEVMGEGTAVLNQVAKLYGFGIELEQGIVGGASLDAHGKPLIDPVLNLASRVTRFCSARWADRNGTVMLVSGLILITLIIAERHIMFFTIVLLYTLSGPLLWCLTKLKHRREQRREAARALP